MTSSAFFTCGSQARLRRRASPSPNTWRRTSSSRRRVSSSRFCCRSASVWRSLRVSRYCAELLQHLVVDAEVLADHGDLALGARAAAGAGDLGLPLRLRRLEAAGEAGERLARDQVRDELVRRLGLDAVVGRDAVAAVHLAPGVGELRVGVADLARLAVARRVVLLERGLRVVALDGAAGRRVVAGGGEGERVAADVAQRHDRLHEALAERRLARRSARGRGPAGRRRRSRWRSRCAAT